MIVDINSTCIESKERDLADLLLVSYNKRSCYSPDYLITDIKFDSSTGLLSIFLNPDNCKEVTINLGQINVDEIIKIINKEIEKINNTKVDKSYILNTTNGIQGGGDLTENRTLSIKPSDEHIQLDGSGIKIKKFNEVNTSGTVPSPTQEDKDNNRILSANGNWINESKSTTNLSIPLILNNGLEIKNDNGSGVFIPAYNNENGQSNTIGLINDKIYNELKQSSDDIIWTEFKRNMNYDSSMKFYSNFRDAFSKNKTIGIIDNTEENREIKLVGTIIKTISDYYIVGLIDGVIYKYISYSNWSESPVKEIISKLDSADINIVEYDPYYRGIIEDLLKRCWEKGTLWNIPLYIKMYKQTQYGWFDTIYSPKIVINKNGNDFNDLSFVFDIMFNRINENYIHRISITKGKNPYIEDESINDYPWINIEENPYNEFAEVYYLSYDIINNKLIDESNYIDLRNNIYKIQNSLKEGKNPIIYIKYNDTNEFYPASIKIDNRTYGELGNIKLLTNIIKDNKIITRTVELRDNQQYIFNEESFILSSPFIEIPIDFTISGTENSIVENDLKSALLILHDNNSLYTKNIVFKVKNNNGENLYYPLFKYFKNKIINGYTLKFIGVNKYWIVNYYKNPGNGEFIYEIDSQSYKYGDKTIFLSLNEDLFISPQDVDTTMTPEIDSNDWDYFYNLLLIEKKPTIYIKTENSIRYYPASYKLLKQSNNKFIGSISLIYTNENKLLNYEITFNNEKPFIGVNSQYDKSIEEISTGGTSSSNIYLLDISKYPMNGTPTSIDLLIVNELKLAIINGDIILAHYVVDSTTVSINSTIASAHDNIINLEFNISELIMRCIISISENLITIFLSEKVILVSEYPSDLSNIPNGTIFIKTE